MEIIVASSNKGKIKEIKEILKDYDVNSYMDYMDEIEIDEDQDTCEGNALKKARVLSRYFKGKACLADDSGIFIDALDGFPGVKSARWMEGTYEDRNNGVLEKLKETTNRSATFKTVMALVFDDVEIIKTGEIKGVITDSPRGTNGFGYDSIFEVDGITMAERTSEEKDEMSARKIALNQIKDEIDELSKDE